MRTGPTREMEEITGRNLMKFKGQRPVLWPEKCLAPVQTAEQLAGLPVPVQRWRASKTWMSRELLQQ